jgi:hypothetical protein
MVQIYQNEELNDVVFDITSTDEWKQIAQELNLDNQLKFIESSNSPNPYPFINESMERIFTTLCPRKVDVKDYNKTTIPLEVLKQLSFSVKEGHFSKVEVWYDDKSPDPFLVGINCDYYAYDRQYSRLKDDKGKDILCKTDKEIRDFCELLNFPMYNTGITNYNKYLVARWGDEIKPLNELKQTAKERLMEIHGSQLKKDIEIKSRALNLIQENATLYLNGEISESDLKGSIN